MVIGAGEADSGVSPDQLGPAQVIDDAIGTGELYSQLPFRGLHGAIIASLATILIC